MSTVGVDFVLRASTSAFTAGVASAKNGIKDLKKSFKQMELGSIGRMIGVGGLVAGLSNAVQSARELAEEAHRTGKGIDDGTAALIRFGDTMSGLRKTANAAFGVVASGMEQLGIYVGALVYGWDNAADAARKMGEEAAAANKKIVDEKLMAAQKELAKFREESAFKRGSDEEKINMLLSRQVELLQQQNAVGKDTAAGVALQVDIEKNRAQIAEVNASLTKRQAEDAKKRAEEDAKTAAATAAEKANREQTLITQSEQLNADFARTEELKKQQAALEEQERKLSKMLALSSMLNAAGGGVFNDASDEALKERLRRSSQRVLNQQNNPLGKDGSVGQMIIGADIGRLQMEISNIKAELAFREKMRRDFALGGEAQARRNFGGDPVEFDRVFAQLVQDTRDTKKIQADTFEEIREMNLRQKSGLPVINVN